MNVRMLLLFLAFIPALPSYSQTVKNPVTDDSAVSSMLINAKKETLLGHVDQSIERYKAILKKDPSCDAALFELANISNNKGLVYQAIGYLNQAIRIDSTNKWYLQALCQLYQQTGKYDSTTYFCKRLIVMNPDNLDNYYNLANSYIYANNIPASIATYTQAEHRFGVTEDLSLEKYKLYLSVKDTVNAIKEIEALTVKFPNEQNYLSILAKLYHDTRNYKKAEYYYQMVEKVNPADPYIHITLSDFYKQRKNSKKAFEELKKGFSSKSLDCDFKLKIFEQYLNDTIAPFLHPKDADELSEIIYQTHPTEIKAILVRGNSLFIHKRFNESKTFFSKALEMDSLNIYALDYYIRSKLITNDTLQIVPALEKAIRLLPTNSSYFYFLGSILFSKKQYDKVIPILQAGLQTTTNNAMREDFYLQLAEAYYYDKQDSLSTAYYRKVISLNPKNSMALNNFSYHLLQMNRELQGALELAELAVKLTPKNSNNLDTYAWALYKNGKLKDAKKMIKKAKRFGGEKNDVVLEHYGDILFKLGMKSKALKTWIQAGKYGEGSALLHQKIVAKKLIE